jgi:uncharacterized glyoxalase superfamily protein PhnB
MTAADNALRFRSAAPCFAVANVGETIRWYEELLGFEGHRFPQHEPYVFGILVRDRIEIMLQRIADYQKPELYNSRDGGVWDAYIRMRGVRQFYDSIKDRVAIIRPLQQQFYGDWEFEVKDPNGYVLVFSELIDSE